MELKQLIRYMIYYFLTLLIVPYGIETRRVGCDDYQVGLLIVPYGIET